MPEDKYVERALKVPNFMYKGGVCPIERDPNMGWENIGKFKTNIPDQDEIMATVRKYISYKVGSKEIVQSSKMLKKGNYYYLDYYGIKLIEFKIEIERDKKNEFQFSTISVYAKNIKNLDNIRLLKFKTGNMEITFQKGGWKLTSEGFLKPKGKGALLHIKYKYEEKIYNILLKSREINLKEFDNEMKSYIRQGGFKPIISIETSGVKG